MLVAGVILLLGLTVSLAAALLWRSSVHAHDKQTFQTTATDVTETIETRLRRDTDLVATLRTVLTMQPGLSPSGFDQWYTDLEGYQRQAGGLCTLVVKSIPANELVSFQEHRNADPDFRSLMGGDIPPFVADRRLTTACSRPAG